MPLDIPMPWLTHVNPAEAISSGAAAGGHAASVIAGREENASRLAQDAIQHNQQIQAEGARLSQQEHIANMEMQSRKEIAEQNRLRQDQQMAITGAYHQAQLGIEKGRLDEQKAIADKKSQDAAAAFQREQAFASDVAGGTNVMDAYRKNPVSASVLNAITRTQLKEGTGGKPVLREGKFPLIEYDPITRKATTVYTPPESSSISKADTEDLRDLRHERDALEKKVSGKAFEQKIGLADPAQNQRDERRLREVSEQIETIKRGKKSPDSAGAKDKVTRAHALGIAHPDWTKEQIIDAVNKEMP
jgi:hypothetical protein